jgi:di/tricarboxylate transporter
MSQVTTGMLVVFGLIAVALVLFVTERISSDITAIGVLVTLAVLEPVTGVDTADAIAGFASPATVTIIAMYILSAGIQGTGIVDRLGVYLGRVTGGSETRLLAATVGTTSVAAGIVNNTPVVAVFIPMITGLAERAGISPSKLLLPLSYAAMLGGTLTLVGTSMNILASDLSRRLLGRPLGMFEFTPVGVVILVVGAAYLLTVGRVLTPERIEPTRGLTDEFQLEDHLFRLVVRDDAPLVGVSVTDAQSAFESDESIDADLLQIERGDEAFLATTTEQTLEPGDVLIVRASMQDLNRMADAYDLRQLPRAEVADSDLAAGGTLVEAITLPESRLVGRTVADAKLDERFDTTVLAIKRGGTDRLRTDLESAEIRAGDTLLLHTVPPSVEHLVEVGDLVVTHASEGEIEEPPHAPPVDVSEVAPLSPKTPVALGIMAIVVLLAALGVVPIVISALGGVFAMVVTGCLKAADAYDAVSWNVVFLLSGVLPLGVALQRTGGDELIASILVSSADVLPVLAVLGLFYLLTGLLANVVTPVASVVLMIPIAVDTATRIGADGVAFVFVVAFAASSAFTTPVGYQTNLMVFGPGGYRFLDYVKVGGPLQLLLAVVVPLAVAAVFGL